MTESAGSKQRRDQAPGLAWAALVGVVAALTLTIWLFTREKSEAASPYPDAAAPTKQTAHAARQVEQRGLVTRTIEVGNQWQRVNFPPRHWFQLAPQKPIQLRLLNGREFTQNPGEDLSVGEIIPGFSVFVRSTLPPDSGLTKVVLSTWQKG